MSQPSQSRRAVVVLKSGADSSALPTIGSRSLHQYWALLKTHFRSVFLPPQSLSDGTSTQWTWREPGEAPPLTTAELATVRKRLNSAQRSFSDSVDDAPEPTGAEARRAGSVLPQLRAHMDAVVNTLTAQPDASLAAYVVRSEHGLLLHSWGLPAALTPHYPDTTECEIAGTVFAAADRPAPDCEVLLENPDGAVLDRTRTDPAGRFHFAKIPPGRYRARAISEREEFSPKGVDIEVERTSVTGVELRALAKDNLAAAQVPATPSRRRRVAAFIWIGSLAAVVAVFVWWWSPTPPVASTIATSPAAQPNVAAETFGRPRAGQTKAGLQSMPRPAGAMTPASDLKTNSIETSRAPVTKVEMPERDAKRRPTIVEEKRTAGLGTEPSGAAANAAPPNSLSSAAAARAGAAGNVSASAGVGVGGSEKSSAAASTAAVSAAAATPSKTSATPSTPTAAVGPTPTPAPPKQTPPPHPSAVATSSSSPTPTPSPESESPPTNQTNLDDSKPVKAEPASTDVSSANSSNADSESAKTAPLALPDSTPDDQAPDVPRPLAQSTATDVTPIDDIAPILLAPASSATNLAATTFSNLGALHHPLRARIRVMPWQSRLLQDAILPTTPTRIGEDDAIGALRERLFRERQNQIPLLFKQPAIRVGFVIEFPLDATAPLNMRWRGNPDPATVHTTVVGRRAEISWPGIPAPGTTCMLVADTGRELAQVTANERGELTAFTADSTVSWPWIGVERAADKDAGLSNAEWTTRLEWRVLSGAPAGSAWRRDDHWLNHHGHRLDLMPGPHALGPTSHALALVDRVTGWAIVSEIEQAQETPATAVSLSR